MFLFLNILSLCFFFSRSGNWSPTDFATGSTFPPSSSSEWKDVNRDLVVVMSDSRIVTQFMSLYKGDYARGIDWYPYHKKSKPHHDA